MVNELCLLQLLNSPLLPLSDSKLANSGLPFRLS